MGTLLIALAAGLGFIVAYHTYGRWLGQRVFRVAAENICPSHRLRDDNDYVPTPRAVVFGHHFTSIAGTGPIVGPAIAVMWGWLPALLWVVLGSIFIGAVHDFGALVVSLRNNGQTVGDIAGRVINKRVRLLFLFTLFMALTIVLAIFGLVIAAVFRMFPAAIFPCVVQIPLAIAIGFWLHRKGVSLIVPSLIALAVMYLTVVFGDENTSTGIASIEWIEHALHRFNATLAGWPTMVWVIVLLGYSYIASVLPVWVLLQPRDYINSLQLISALALIVVGLIVAAFFGGAPVTEGAGRVPLEIVAPMVNWRPEGAPMIFPFLFITIACGAISGFHCLVSSGTSSKQLKSETDAQFVGYGSMITEGFLATLVILACVAGLGLGISGKHSSFQIGEKTTHLFWPDNQSMVTVESDRQIIIGTRTVGSGFWSRASSHGEFVSYDYDLKEATAVGATAWSMRYASWSSANGLGRTVGSFVEGSANFLKAMGISGGIAVALMGVLVASFAGTTLDTACRLQRYVIQELAATFASRVSPTACAACGYDLSFNVSGNCPECAKPVEESRAAHRQQQIAPMSAFNPVFWLTNKHGATVFAVILATLIAASPQPGQTWTWATAGSGGMILWPMFGATNQLLGGLAFMVIGFWLWRRRLPVWFLILPMIFMLIMPAWAMLWQLFIADADKPGWLFAPTRNWVLVCIALATLALELWMIIEALLLWPRVRGVLEPVMAPLPMPAVVAAPSRPE